MQQLHACCQHALVLGSGRGQDTMSEGSDMHADLSLWF
jgi:hypothetical protein